jgi:hypothetical protein
LDVLIFPAAWKELGAKAGPIRNKMIVANADAIVAFWDGKSRGTLNSIVLAEDAGLPVTIYGSNGEQIPLFVAHKAAELTGVVH